MENEEATSGSEYALTDSEEEEQQEGRQAEPLQVRHLANRMGVDTSVEAYFGTADRATRCARWPRVPVPVPGAIVP